MPTTPLREALQQAEAEINAGRPGEALRSCDQLLGTHPRWLAAQRLRAKSLVALNQLAEAEKLLDGILAAHPEDVEAFIDRAYLAQCKHDLMGALACYRRACELARDNAALRAIHNQLAVQLNRPAYTPSHTGLARLYQRSELFAHALREWDVALQANPNRLDAQIGMAETLWRMGDAQRAQEVCRYILRHMPTCLKPLLLLVVFELDAGHGAEAQRLTQMVAEMDPEQLVAGELFGDLVASGHVALAQLFRVAVRAQTTPLMAANQSQTGTFPAINGQARPGVPQPTGQLATGPLFLRPKTNPLYEPAPTSKLEFPTSAPSNGNGNGHGTIEDFFSQSRASEIPAEFEYVFKETEYMLWSRDQEEPITAEIPVIGSAPTASAPPAPAPSPPPSPPAAPDEAEMRYIRFLQEQGARPLDDTFAPTSLPATDSAKIAVPDFLIQAMAESAITSAPSEDPVTAPPEPPEPIVPSQPFAPSPPPEATPEREPVPATPMRPIEALPSGEPEALAADNAPDPWPVAEEPAQVEDAALPAQELPPAAPLPTPAPAQVASEPPAPVTTAPATPPPVTIEAIQQGLESAGFARLDTGRLAAVASSLDHAPPATPAPSVDADQHLEMARTLRRQGHMGEALVEYRALVKVATDRMPEIIRDLRDAAIEDPREAEIQRLLGDAYIRQGDYVEALEAYNQASALRHEVGH